MLSQNSYKPQDPLWQPHQMPKIIQKGLPPINPNAVPTSNIIGNLLVKTKYKYFDNNRPFVEAPPQFPIDTQVAPLKGCPTLPMNPRLYDAYQTAVEETRMRTKHGVNYTP